MPTVRTKRELSAIKRDALDVVKMNKADIKEALEEYRKLSKVVKRTGRASEKRQLAAEKSGSERAALRSERAEEAYRFTRREYDTVGKKLKECLGFIEREYGRIIDAYRSRGNIKAMERAYKELDEYRDGILSEIEKIDEATPNLFGADDLDIDGLIDEDEDIPEEPVREEKRVPAYAPPTVTSTVTSVTVEPVSIDVTPIVERAIASFVNRLDASFGVRLDEYVKNLKLPEAPTNIPEATEQSALVSDGVAVQLSSELLEEEGHIVEKLRTMCTSISSLLEELTALSSSYHDISLKCRELAELQRTINDMQRHTAREQKGVEVNQKLIADEQAEIIAAGTLIAESQRELAERQSALNTLQGEAVSLSEKNSLDAESLVAKERELSAKQAELAGVARKIADTVEQSLIRQDELYREQKEAVSRTKKLIREQKQLAEKAVASGTKKPRAKKDASQADDANGEPVPDGEE